jgi:hypothetical protein
VLALLLVATAPAQQRPESPPLTPLKDLVRLECKDGVLELNWTNGVPAAARRISAQGPEGRWVVEPIAGNRSGILITRGQAGTRRPDQFTDITISTTAGAVTIIAERAINPAALRLAQRGHQLALTVVSTGKATNFASADLLDLRAQRPAIVREILLPILEQVTGEPDLLLPGAADAYRVFDQIGADERTAVRVNELLSKLAAPAAGDRVHATDELESLGERAIPALLRVDRDSLSPEAAGRVAQIIAHRTRRSFDDPASMRDDAMFLVDCLEFNDDRIRAAARARLEQLRGTSISIQDTAIPADWSRAADQLRTILAARHAVERENGAGNRAR